MQKETIYIKIASWTLLAVIVEKMVATFLKLRDPVDWIFYVCFILLSLIITYKFFDKKKIDKGGLFLTTIFIVWLLFEFFRAIPLVEGYYVWKSIFKQLFISLFYLVIILSSFLEITKAYYGLYWKFFIPLVIFSFIIDGTPIQLEYTPFATLMLFFILIPNHKKWLLFAIIIFYFSALEQRNDMIKILIVSSIGFSISYLYQFIPKWSIKFTHLVFLITPIILLGLGIQGTFNIFKMDDYIQGDYEQKVKTSEGEEEDDLKADTRTFIFENVFYTMNKYDAWIMGRSPAYGDEGVDDFWGIDEETGLIGRYGNEVGIMDILLWYGLIGVVIYFLIYIRASYLAIYKSRSRFAKGLGLYVAFLWMWAFVWEKPMFDTFYMMDLVLLGLCFSTKFRQFNDAEMGEWVRGIFIKKSPSKQYPKSIITQYGIENGKGN